MKRKLHLHIGSPKTGTTYLQMAFFNSREVLAEKGYVYPGTEFSHQKLFFVTNCERKDWARQFRGQKTTVVKKIVETYINSLERDFFQSDSMDCIMSTEDLFISNESYIQNLLSYLDNFFSDIKVYLFLRDPVEYYRSYQQELIKARSYIDSPFIFRYPFKEVIKAWEKYFDIEVIKYSLKKDSLKVLSQSIGFSYENLSKEHSTNNSSTSIEQIALLEKIQKNLYQNSDDILKVHLKIIPQINAPFTNKSQLQEWVKTIVYQNHLKDLQWLMEQYGIDFTQSYPVVDEYSCPSFENKRACVRDVFELKHEQSVEKYEALVIDLLLKKIMQN